MLRNNVGEVYSLDLYETRDVRARNLRAIAGRGNYLPPSSRVDWESPVGPAEVEVTAGAESLSIVERAINNGSMEAEPDARNLNGPFTGNLFLELENEPGVISGSVSAPWRLDGRTAWTGSVRGWSDRPGLDFVLEQYGSIEPVLYLVTLLYYAFDRLRDRHDRPTAADECLFRAQQTCGPGNVKSWSFSANSSIGVSVDVAALAAGTPSGGVSGGRGGGCQFECFEERWFGG